MPTRSTTTSSKHATRAMGIFLDEADVMASAEMARRSGSFAGAHKNLRLNQRADRNSEAKLVTPEIWDLGNKPLDVRALEGRECVGGLDLSFTTDLSALVLVFPDASGGFDVLPFIYTPLGQLENRRPAERDTFKVWLQEGHLIGIGGPVIQYEQVVAHLISLSRQYRIKHIACDRWRIKDFKQEMDKARCTIPLVDHGQGFRTMGPTIAMFIEKALLGLIRHGGQPALAASVASVQIDRDIAGNMRFTKEKSAAASIKIDAAVALAMAIYSGSQTPPDPSAELNAAIIARGGLLYGNAGERRTSEVLRAVHAPGLVHAICPVRHGDPDLSGCKAG
jgi:phage terminase large subunit-like protein